MPATPQRPHALVTGGGRGIGRAIAAALARQGMTVTVLGRQRAPLEEAVAAGEAHFADVADVASEQAVRAAITRAAERQPIDILVANAGAAESAPFAKSDAALFARMMDVNFMGVVHSIHAALPSMGTRPAGRIVAVASTAGLKGYAYVSAYVAAKHAVVGLVRALALELAAARVPTIGLPALRGFGVTSMAVTTCPMTTGTTHAPRSLMDSLPTERYRTIHILRLPEVCRATGLGRSMVYQLEAMSQFPRRVKIGARAVGLGPWSGCCALSVRPSRTRNTGRHPSASACLPRS